MADKPQLLTPQQIIEQLTTVEERVKLEAAKLPLIPVDASVTDSIGAFVNSMQVLIAKKRDLTDVMVGLGDLIDRAAMIGMPLPKAVAGVDGARRNIEAIEKVLEDAYRTLEREVTGGSDEDEE